MSIEALLERTIVAFEKNTAILERVVVGQEAALAKIAEGKPATTRTPRGAKAADPAPETTATAAVAEGAPVDDVRRPHPLLAAANSEMANDAPTANFRAGDFTQAEVKNEFVGWLGENPDADIKKDRSAFVVALAAHFGVAKPFGPQGLNDPDQLKQALFFLRRKREGMKVDFNADYEFDGDPLADQTQDVGEIAEEDPLG